MLAHIWVEKEDDEGNLGEAIDCIDTALKKIKASRWETPEQWEKRTGEPWPDNGAVYFQYRYTNGKFCGWQAASYLHAQVEPLFRTEKLIVVATEAGPPPDGWEPEEENNAE
jgi:hypothetical protein